MFDRLLEIPGIDSGVVYLLRDEFTTDAAAPLTSPRTCEPGPGTLTLTQTDGQLSISGGKLTYPSQTTPVWGDQGFYAEKQGGGSFARVAGRAFFFTLNQPTTASPLILSWHTTTALGTAGDVNSILEVLIEAGTFRVLDGAALVAVPFTWSASTDELFALVLRGTGGLVFKRIGGVWTLVWVGVVATTSNLYPAFKNYQGVGTLDGLKVRDLVGGFASDYGLATQNVASPNGAYAGDADGILDITVTSPSSISAECGVKYRVQDANNYWWAGFTTAGRFQVRSYSGGTPTNQIDVAGVISTSQTRTMRVIYKDTKHDAYTLSGSTWTKQGSQVVSAFLNTQTGLATDIGSGWTGANLREFAISQAAYGQLS